MFSFFKKKPVEPVAPDSAAPAEDSRAAGKWEGETPPGALATPSAPALRSGGEDLADKELLAASAAGAAAFVAVPTTDQPIERSGTFGSAVTSISHGLPAKSADKDTDKGANSRGEEVFNSPSSPALSKADDASATAPDPAAGPSDTPATGSASAAPETPGATAAVRNWLRNPFGRARTQVPEPDPEPALDKKAVTEPVSGAGRAPPSVPAPSFAAPISAVKPPAGVAPPAKTPVSPVSPDSSRPVAPAQSTNVGPTQKEPSMPAAELSPPPAPVPAAPMLSGAAAARQSTAAPGAVPDARAMPIGPMAPVVQVPAADDLPKKPGADKRPANVQQAPLAVAVAPPLPVANPVEPPALEPATSPAPRAGWMDRLRGGLRKTGSSITTVFTGTRIDEALYEELEDALLMADTGVKATQHLLTDLRRRVKDARASDPAAVKGLLTDALTDLLRPLEKALVIGEFTPTVIMVAGVNGAGKTTSIGKLTRHLANSGASVLLAAADTFRAAAREQLGVWADRNTVEIISQEGGDPAAVSFDAVTAGRARRKDVVLVDTAGRLPTQLHLMEELRKIRRTIAKAAAAPGSVGMGTPPHEVLLVLDGNTGQNALAQVRAFDDALQLTGLIVTKLDGTAKGGVLAAIAQERPIPVYFIGVGEKLEDLETFNAREFAQALLG